MMESPSKTLIRPRANWVGISLRDLWHFRELLFLLICRDIKVRYKQTTLGVLWAVLQPLLTMLVFSVFFGRMAKMPSDGIPYPLFSYAGVLPWTFFSLALTQSSRCLLDSSHLIRKIYFPRAILPIASVMAGLMDLLIAIAFFLVLMCYYGTRPPLTLVFLPLLLALTMTVALGPVMCLSALNVQYRDVRFVIPFMAQFWMFATPVIYPRSLLSDQWKTLYDLNPMVGVIEGFRWAFLGTPLPVQAVVTSALVSVAVLLASTAYFASAEDSFADLI